MLHRDVKPENVLLDTSTTPATVKLADFGIARLVGDSRLSRVTALIGTPTYLPPEVYAGGPAVAAGDLYLRIRDVHLPYRLMPNEVTSTRGFR